MYLFLRFIFGGENLNTKEIIKQLATNRKITIAELERVTNIANGTIGKWDKQNPQLNP